MRLTWLLPLALASCGLLGPIGEPSPFERAASDLTLAWVAYDNAPDEEAEREALEAMASVLAEAAGLDLDLEGVVPSPGIIVLVGEAFPDATQGEIDTYARIVTVLIRGG